MRIAVFASTALLRAGLEEAFTHTAGVTHVVTAITSADLVDRCLSDKPDVAVLEVEANGSSTEDAIIDLRRELPAVRLIGICTGPQSQRKAGDLLALGLHGVASVHRGMGTLVDQLRRDDGVLIGDGDQLPEAPPLPTPTHRQTKDSPLTRREVVVLAYVSAGLTAAEIADCLGVSFKTIENHKQRIYSKLEVHNQTHAVSKAFQRGILDPAYAYGGRVRQSLPNT